MDCDFPPPPEAGPQGLVIDEFHVEQEQEVETFRCGPPSEPGRAIYLYDEAVDDYAVWTGSEWRWMSIALPS